MNKKISTLIILLAIFALALFLRVFFVSGSVFSDPIKYSADDGVYHMRLVENQLLGGHFPSRLFFDPFTNFPNGTYVHFSPLYDYLLAFIIWIISFGRPTLEIINKVAPFYPAVMGSLVIFLVYFITRQIWSRPIAILSALFIGVMPNFMMRSMLGITDHHVGEVFFSTLTILFLVLLLKTRENSKNLELQGEASAKVNADNQRKFWLYTILTGVSLGLYFLTWTGALLFLFIFFCFIVFYYLIKYFLGSVETWILKSGSAIFLIALAMITPFFGYPDFLTGRIYNVKHFICFASSLFIFLVMGLLGSYLKKKDKKPYVLPLTLAVGFSLIAVVIKIFLPFLWDTTIKIATEVNIGMVDNKFAREMIGEMGPLRIRGAFNYFSTIFYFSLISLGILVYKFVKEKKAEHLLIIIWTLILLFVAGLIPAFGQNRNAYYLCVVFSILASFIIVEGFKFGWNALRKAEEFAKDTYLQFYFYVSSIVIIVVMFFFVFYPYPFNIDEPFPGNLPSLILNIENVASSNAFPGDDMYAMLKWLREKTPDPGLDYNALYIAPPLNKSTGLVEPYVYAPQAYGILARWDIGHMITYYAHRLPVANPFQQGIGYINNDGTVVPGEATFFLATDEKKATSYLDQLKSRYIITDNSLSDPNGQFKGYVKWINANMDEYAGDKISETEPTKFDLAMSTRLYFLDGSASSIAKTVNDKKINLVMPSLDHFRLVYESKNNTSTFWGEDYKTTKELKVFEYVKGAKITGTTIPEYEVTISTNVTTNQKREFVYKKVLATTDGSFEFVVPYATGNQEKSDVIASEYKINIWGQERSVKVSEEDILQGKTIKIY